MLETAAILCDVPRDERHVVPEAGTRASSRITELDGLRGMAVIFVILYHYFVNLAPAAPGPTLSFFRAWFQMGWCGVDLFFVLSGFLIGGILLDARESPRYFQTFYSRRFHRILPLYYIWIGAYFLIAFTLLPHSSGSFKIEPEKWTIVPTYIFFVQNLVKK